MKFYKTSTGNGPTKDDPISLREFQGDEQEEDTTVSRQERAASSTVGHPVMNGAQSTGHGGLGGGNAKTRARPRTASSARFPTATLYLAAVCLHVFTWVEPTNGFYFFYSPSLLVVQVPRHVLIHSS